jgi:hypothetical protein
MKKAWLQINELFCKKQVQADRVYDEILRWAEDKAELRDRNQFEEVDARLDGRPLELPVPTIIRVRKTRTKPVQVSPALDRQPEELPHKFQRIEELPGKFQRMARKWLRARHQHGSRTRSRIPDDQRLQMLELHRSGATFRDLEAIYHLIPLRSKRMPLFQGRKALSWGDISLAYNLEGQAWGEKPVTQF